MVIYNAGPDMYGSGTLWYYYDTSTKSKDLKMVYKPWVFITKNLIKQEVDNSNLTEDNTTPGPFIYAGKRYKETTGNYDGGGGITTSWGVTVTSDATYNTAVRNKAAFGDTTNNILSEGDARAMALTKSRGSPRWKGTIELKGERFTPGELITFTSSSAGILNEELRIKSITHNITKTGWFTTLNVEEDERELQGRG